MLASSTQPSFYRKTACSQVSKNWRTYIDSSINEQPTIRGEDDKRTLQAVAEGRRLYVGNLPYMAKTKDVEKLFADEFYQIEHINMSIDPYSGRNPSYCFIELSNKEQAERAMLELNGEPVLGRPVRIGPGVAGSKKKRSYDDSSGRAAPVFDRWTRTDAADHWTKPTEQGRRLFLGGLPPMPDHHTVNEDVRRLFSGFKIEAVSKVIIPRSPAYGDPHTWNHRYLFVDFSTADEAKRAMKATNGRLAWDVKIKVEIARGPASRKFREREDYEEHQQLSAASCSLPYD